MSGSGEAQPPAPYCITVPGLTGMAGAHTGWGSLGTGPHTGLGLTWGAGAHKGLGLTGLTGPHTWLGFTRDRS